MEKRFDLELLPEAVEFLNRLDKKPREKIYYNILKARYINDVRLLKKLNSFIWEFRTSFGGNSYRLFSFWDKTEKQKTLVIATHGILKKSQKTPKTEIQKAEIQKAEMIRIQYFENKKRKKLRS